MYRVYRHWLYLITVAAGVCMFYYGAEVHPDFFLVMGFSMAFMGLLLIHYECEKAVINRHKPQDEQGGK